MNDTADNIETLKRFNKWLRGKGKKYVGSYVDVMKIGNAIKFATDILSHSPSGVDSMTIYNMAIEDAAYRKHNHEAVTDFHKKAIRSYRKYVNWISPRIEEDAS